MQVIVVTLSAWACLVSSALAAGDVALVERGRGACVIVLDDPTTAAAGAAAGQIQHWIKAVSDAKISIVGPSDPRAAAAGRIVVGAGKLAGSLGVDTRGLGPEGIRVRTVNRDLVLLGVDRYRLPNGTSVDLDGTFYAAMTFVERCLGVRWLWPGELGTVVPRMTTVVVPPIDLSFTPPLRMRKYRSRNCWGAGGSTWPGMPTGENRGERMNRQAKLWLLRHRLQAGGDMPEDERAALSGLAPGGSLALNYGHAFRDWYGRYGKEHPEWFALQPNGSRLQPGTSSRSQFCVTNEGLIAELVRCGREYLDSHPEAGSYNICPNDGGAAKFCGCEKCKALDVPGTGTTGRYAWHFNRVAQGIAATHPDRYVCSYAYSSYRTGYPGLRMHDNVVLGMVMYGASAWLCDAARQESHAQWRSWDSVVRQRFLRPNVSAKGGGLPLLYPHKMAEDLKPIFRGPLVGVDFASVGHHWANEGLNYYVLAKLIWDPESDVDAVIDDYCRSGFGAAAPAVRRYFRRLEDLTAALAKAVPLEESRSLIWPWRLPQCKQVYSPPILAELVGILAEARGLADSDAARRRVDFLREGLGFAELATNLDRRAAAALRARRNYVRDHRFSWAVTSSYKGGGLAALGPSGIDELPPAVLPRLAGFPLFWKNIRPDQDIAAVGYKLLDGMHVFLFLMGDRDRAADGALHVYLDADGDRGTGREKIGNDYYLLPGKRSATYYGKDRQTSSMPIDACYYHDRAVIVGVQAERFAGTPLERKFSMTISTAGGKTRAELDATAAPLELYSPSAR